MSSEQRVILVTGSNTGIGLEVVRQLASQGHIVYLSARNPDKGKDAVAQLKSESGLDVKFVQLDITDQASVAQAKETIEQAEGRLDVLVNNAGDGLHGTKESAIEPNFEALKRAFEINFYGPLRVTSTFIPLLRKGKKGYTNIVNVSTDMASTTRQAGPKGYLHSWITYNTSKAAANSYAVSLAAELKPDGIRVNVVTPGFTTTKLNGFAPGGKTAPQGAEPIVKYALLEPKDEGITAKYFSAEEEWSW